MMNLLKLIEKRKAGKLKIGFEHNWNYSIPEILSTFGFKVIDESSLFKVDANVAQKILKHLLWKNLANRLEVMTKNEAEELSSLFLSLS